MSTPISLLVCLCRIALVIWVQNHCHRTIKLLRITVLSRVYGSRRKPPLTKALNLLLLWRPSSSCPCEFSAPGLPGHKKDVYQFQSIYSVNFTPKLLKTLLLSHFCSSLCRYCGFYAHKKVTKISFACLTVVGRKHIIKGRLLDSPKVKLGV